MPVSAETLSHCGMQPAALQDDGLPQLEADEVFQRSFDAVSLVAGGANDLGAGQLHFTNLCAPGQLASSTYTC